MVNIDFKQLAIFARLADEKHFARTAEHFHLTASAVTRSIQRLENEVGCRLLLRNNRQVQLTPAGEELAAFAEETLARWQQASIQLQTRSHTIKGELKIYSSVTASYSILSHVLDHFRLIFPEVEIRLHTGDQAQAIAQVKNGQDDIAVAAKPDILPSSMVFKTLTYSPLRFIMSSSLGTVNRAVNAQLKQRGIINPADLPMIVAEKGMARQRFYEWLKKQQLNANIYAKVSGHEAIVSMVALGCGIGLVPEIVIENSPLRDKITVINAAPELTAFQIGLCALEEKLQVPQIKRFWEVASENFFVTPR